MLNLLKTIVAVGVVTGCAPTPTAMRVPGNSIAAATPVLAEDTMTQLAMALQLGTPPCTEFGLLQADVVEPVSNGRYGADGTLLAGRWVEVWTVDRCGQEVIKRIIFTADEGRGTFIEISV